MCVSSKKAPISGSAGDHELHIFSDGEWKPGSHWSADRFLLSIYSQKMLYELVSDTGAFLCVCDESPVVNKRVWKERWYDLEQEYLNEQITLRGLRARQLTRFGENYPMQNVPSDSCSQALIIPFAAGWPSPGAVTFPLEHYQLHIAAIQALAADTDYPAGTVRISDGIYGMPVVYTTALRPAT